MPDAPRELLTAAAIAAQPGVERVHPLDANARFLKKSLGEPTGLSQLGVSLNTVPPGCASTAFHRHLYEEEFVYVLSGHGEALIGEQRVEVGAGDFLGFARGGDAHVLHNTGSEPLVLLVGGTRLEQDVCDYPQAGKRLFVAGEVESYVPLPPDACKR